MRRVTLPEAARASKARRLWESRDLSSRLNGRIVQLEVGTLDDHETVAMEW